MSWGVLELELAQTARFQQRTKNQPVVPVEVGVATRLSLEVSCRNNNNKLAMMISVYFAWQTEDKRKNMPDNCIAKASRI